MSDGTLRFQIHLSTALGLVLLIAILIHLNFAPLAVTIGRNNIVIRYGWPLMIGEYEPEARFLANMLFAIGLLTLFYKTCEACEKLIRWSATAIVEASKRAIAARTTLARLKAASRETRKP